MDSIQNPKMCGIDTKALLIMQLHVYPYWGWIKGYGRSDL